jgi:hypothetical protein
MTVHQTLKPYDFHGVDFNATREGDTEATGACPFCDASKRLFHVNLKTGQYNSKCCGKGGNVYTFLKEMIKWSQDGTTDDDYKELAADIHGVKKQTFKDEGWVRDHEWSDERWYIPIYNIRGSIVNVRVYVPGHPVMATAGLTLYPHRLEKFKGDGPIIICEGEKDALAVVRLIKSSKIRATVLSVPGANVFKNEWRDLFANRDLFFWYDNDGPGEEGAKRAAAKMQGISRSCRILRWPSSLPEKWDVRDHIHKALDTDKQIAKEVLTDLMDCSGEVTAGGMKPVSNDPDLPKITSFATVLKRCKENYHMNRTVEDGIALMYATVLSIQIPGDPVWMFMVGPPGAGKTMFLRCFERSPWCIFKSSITPRSLISGYRTEDGSDPSLIPRLAGKILVLKDYTEIMTMPRDQMEEMYGIFRGAYDGHVSKSFGNGEQRDFPNCHFGVLAGVTDEIHGDNRASLGERFLKYQFLKGQNYDDTLHIETAIRGIAEHHKRETNMQRVAAAFSNKDVDLKKLPFVNKTMMKRVIALSQVVSYLRATVPRTGKGDEMSYRPTREVGTRVGKQLAKVASALTLVYNTKTIDEKVYRLILQLGIDTAYGWPLEIMQTIMTSKVAVTKENIGSIGNIPSTTLQRNLEDLKTLGAIERKPLPTKGLGRPAYGYAATPAFSQKWADAKIPHSTRTKS